MNEQYLATFYTHLAALRTDRKLHMQGMASRMMPVPRKLSSSCGTCVQYEAADACIAAMDKDTQAVYKITDSGYELIKEYND